MSYEFFALPQNTSGAAVIPISNTPVPLASLTVVTDDNNNITALRANVGWRALSDPTRVLFKIWRSVPITGTLICSVQDGAESIPDYATTTDFEQIIAGLTPGQPMTFVLTAETVDVGTQAQVIGPLSYSAYGTNLSILSYSEFFNNTFGSANIPVGQSPTPVTFATIHVEPSQNVVLQSTACWITSGDLYPKVDVLFKLWRGAPVTGVLVASTDDSADTERSAVTTFSHIDTGFTAAQDVTYVLTAEAPDPNHTANIVGAMTFTALVQSTDSFYTLPQNTAGSVKIPITVGGTPLAGLTLQANPGTVVIVRAAVGWAVSPSLSGNKMAPILFKIWRGAPFSGTLIYSALDSGESDYDFRKVTPLACQDSGFTGPGLVTYTLTAELTKAAVGANVIGPLTFFAISES